MPLDARAAMPPKIGDYEILDKIAEGGMGAVYKARHPLTGELVAIKVLPPATARNPILLKRFEQEYRAAAAMDHPNVVRAIDFCGAGPSPFLVMEYVDGESLGAKVERDGPDAGRPGDSDDRPGVPGAAPGPQAGHGPPRREARQHSRDSRRRGQADRPGPGQGRRQRDEPDQDRPRAGHAALHGPGAVPRRQERRRPLRHLLAGRHTVHDGDRQRRRSARSVRSSAG